MADDLTAYAAGGFAGLDNGNLFSSPAFYAHAVGAWFKETGKPCPSDVRMGRGYSIRVRDMRFTIKHPPRGARTVQFERVE